MQHAATAAAELTYADSGGRTAKVTTRLPFTTPFDTAYSRALAIASAIAPLTLAKLSSIVIRYVWQEEAPVAPDALSNVGYYLCLYYSNDVDTEPIFIPSPNPAVLETTGSFAGIRLDLANPAVVSLADALTTALRDTLTPDGVAFERHLVVGGRTL